MSEWVSVKKQLPPFGEFVEVIYPDDSGINDLKRDFAALWKDDTGVFWSSAGMDEREWSKEGYKIKFWKPMSPDHRGRKPILYTDRNDYFRVKLIKVKV